MLYHNIDYDKESHLRCHSLIFAALLLLGGAALAEVPRVVTDIPAVHSLTAQVIGDLGDPVLLVTGAADPHYVLLRPSQARALARADVVIWVGPGLTPWLDQSLASLAPNAHVVSLLDLPATQSRKFDQRAEIGDNGIDPHAWLDPENARVWLDAIAATLSGADPDNQATYRANAALAALEIDTLLEESRRTLARFQDKNLIFAHDAYGYFTARFGLQIAGVLADGDAAKPGAAHLRKIRQLLQSGSVACAFGEPQQNPALLRTLLQDTAIPTAVLDPAGTRIRPGPDLYGELIRNLALGIADCIND